MEQHGEARREQLMSDLRTLYESLGYKRFSMRRFEEYALYLENKNFLKSDSVLAFTNPDGKLMALKPDVTLSIVKHARPERLGVDVPAGAVERDPQLPAIILVQAVDDIAGQALGAAPEVHLVTGQPAANAAARIGKPQPAITPGMHG